MPALASPELQQAADDVITQTAEPEAGRSSWRSWHGRRATRPGSGSSWPRSPGSSTAPGARPADDAKVAEVIEAALNDPDHPDRGHRSWPPPPATRVTRACSRASRGRRTPPSEVRVAAVEALGAAPAVGESERCSIDLIGEAKGQAQLEPGRRGRGADALPERGEASRILSELITTPDVPARPAPRRPCGPSPSAGDGAPA